MLIILVKLLQWVRPFRNSLSRRRSVQRIVLTLERTGWIQDTLGRKLMEGVWKNTEPIVL